LIVRLVIWSLADTQTNIGELRRYLRDEAVPAFSRVPGLLFKGWFSDEATERWGAIYVWESWEASEQELPSRARLAKEVVKKIGFRFHKSPDHFYDFRASRED